MVQEEHTAWLDKTIIIIIRIIIIIIITIIIITIIRRESNPPSLHQLGVDIQTWSPSKQPSASVIYTTTIGDTFSLTTQPRRRRAKGRYETGVTESLASHRRTR